MGNPNINEINKATRITSETAKELGSKGGKAKAGSRHLSTIIKDIMDNIEWEKTTLKNKDELKRLYGNRGWDAIVYVATTKAMAGDAQAWKWLSENSFGKNIDITSGGETLNNPYAQLTPEELRKLAGN